MSKILTLSKSEGEIRDVRAEWESSLPCVTQELAAYSNSEATRPMVTNKELDSTFESVQERSLAEPHVTYSLEDVNLERSKSLLAPNRADDEILKTSQRPVVRSRPETLRPYPRSVIRGRISVNTKDNVTEPGMGKKGYVEKRTRELAVILRAGKKNVNSLVERFIKTDKLMEGDSESQIKLEITTNPKQIRVEASNFSGQIGDASLVSTYSRSIKFTHIETISKHAHEQSKKRKMVNVLRKLNTPRQIMLGYVSTPAWNEEHQDHLVLNSEISYSKRLGGFYSVPTDETTHAGMVYADGQLKSFLTDDRGVTTPYTLAGIFAINYSKGTCSLESVRSDWPHPKHNDDHTQVHGALPFFGIRRYVPARRGLLEPMNRTYESLFLSFDDEEESDDDEDTYSGSYYGSRIKINRKSHFGFVKSNKDEAHWMATSMHPSGVPYFTSMSMDQKDQNGEYLPFDPYEAWASIHTYKVRTSIETGKDELQKMDTTGPRGMVDQKQRFAQSNLLVSYPLGLIVKTFVGFNRSQFKEAKKGILMIFETDYPGLGRRFYEVYTRLFRGCIIHEISGGAIIPDEAALIRWLDNKKVFVAKSINLWERFIAACLFRLVSHRRFLVTQTIKDDPKQVKTSHWYGKEVSRATSLSNSFHEGWIVYGDKDQDLGFVKEAVQSWLSTSNFGDLTAVMERERVKMNRKLFKTYGDLSKEKHLRVFQPGTKVGELRVNAGIPFSGSTHNISTPYQKSNEEDSRPGYFSLDPVIFCLNAFASAFQKARKLSQFRLSVRYGYLVLVLIHFECGIRVVFLDIAGRASRILSNSRLSSNEVASSQ